MKKAMLLGSVLTIGLVLSACNNGSGSNAGAKDTESMQTESVIQTEQMTETEVTGTEVGEAEIVECGAYVDVEVSDLDMGTGEYEIDGIGTEKYSYHLPQMVLDLPGAKALNEQIITDHQEGINIGLEQAEEKTSQGTPAIKWESFQNENIVSLVVKSDTATESIYYKVYNYDINKDKSISSEDLIEMYGMTQDVFLKKVSDAATRAYEEKYSDNKELAANPIYEEGMERQCSYIQMEQVYPYVNDDGALYACVPVASLAGADWYYKDLLIVDGQ